MDGKENNRKNKHALKRAEEIGIKMWGQNTYFEVGHLYPLQ
jgi:hypothetical protein